jgi:AmiR/NasT family two-component response regulator
MATSKTLLQIVEAGFSLDIVEPINSKALLQIVEAASKSGAKLKITTAMPTETILKILETGHRNVSFVNSKQSAE